MEGSESEAVFDAFNLNPKRFINEVLNAADDLLDGAFEFCLEQAAVITGCGGDGSEELFRGVSHIRNMTQEILDKRMVIWEKYCLRHCFTVPEHFVLPKAQDLSVNSVSVEGLCETELDSQLQTLREKLAAVGKESAELLREVNALEKQASLNSKYEATIAKAMRLYDQTSAQEMLQDIGKAASTLFSRAESIETKRRQEMETLGTIANINFPNKRQHVGNNHDLLSSLEDVQAVANVLKKFNN